MKLPHLPARWSAWTFTDADRASALRKAGTLKADWVPDKRSTLDADGSRIIEGAPKSVMNDAAWHAWLAELKARKAGTPAKPSLHLLPLTKKRQA